MYLADNALSTRAENAASVEELAAIRAVNETAFGGAEEACLVDGLRSSGDALLSLVAVSGNSIIGHVMFSRMWIRTPEGDVPAVALAPVAVRPEYQRKGIGGLLIRRGLETLRARGERIVIVVGHADYYPRFGFSHHLAGRLKHPFPPEAFMAMELSTDALDGVEGAAVYAQAFGI